MVRVGFFNSVHIPCHVAHIQTFIVIHHFCGSCAIPSPLATAFIMTGVVNIYRVIVQEDDWGGGFFFFSLFFFYFLFLPFIFIFFKQDWRVKKSFSWGCKKTSQGIRTKSKKKKKKKKAFCLGSANSMIPNPVSQRKQHSAPPSMWTFLRVHMIHDTWFLWVHMIQNITYEFYLFLWYIINFYVIIGTVEQTHYKIKFEDAAK